MSTDVNIIRDTRYVKISGFLDRNQYMMAWLLPPAKYRDEERRFLRLKAAKEEEKETARRMLDTVLRSITFPDWLVLYMVWSS